MPALLTADEKTALDLLNPVLELTFAEGAEYPGGTEVIKAVTGYSNPSAAIHRDEIKASFRSALIAFMRSGAGGSGVPGQGFTFRSAWSGATTYSAYDVVTYNSGVWFAIGGSTNVVPGTDATKWWGWAQGFLFRDAWSSMTAYVTFDVVTYDGGTWLAVASSTNVTPGTDASKWKALATKGATGAAGTNGAAGAAGAAGTVWRSGAGVPDNALGVNGDFYLRTSNGDVYEKSAGSYSVTASVRGLQGGTNVTVNFNVVGTIAESVGAVWIEAGTLTTVRAYMGCQSPAHTAVLLLYRASTGALILTLNGAGAIATRTTTNLSIPADDMYEIYFKCNTSGGTAMLRNFSWKL